MHASVRRRRLVPPGSMLRCFEDVEGDDSQETSLTAAAAAAAEHVSKHWLLALALGPEPLSINRLKVDKLPS